MVETRKGIIETRKDAAVVIRSVDLSRPGATALREAGIHSLGWTESSPPRRGDDTQAPWHLIMYVTRGQMTWHTGKGVFKQGPGTVFLAGRGHARWYRFARRNTRAVWIHAQLNSKWSRLVDQDCNLTHSSQGPILESLIRGLSREPSGTDATSAAGHYAGLILIHLRRELDDAGNPEERALRERLSTMWGRVESSLHKAWDVSAMSRELYLSQAHFRRIAGRLDGESPMTKLARLRMQHASHLLIETDQSLERVAEAVGYGSAYSFSQAFVRVMGCRPGAFRRGASAHP